MRLNENTPRWENPNNELYTCHIYILFLTQLIAMISRYVLFYFFVNVNENDNKDICYTDWASIYLTSYTDNHVRDPVLVRPYSDSVTK